MAEIDETQAAVIAFLGDPRSHGIAERVTVVRTHASVVFLAGSRAYKLKRAVTYSFLDYGSVARREAACRAEFALNRRTAPELYLAVRAIRRRADGMLGFDGDGETLDWVVEMVRFPDGALFSQMAERGDLLPQLLRDTADVIAAFHKGAEVTPDVGGAPGIAAVLKINAENMREIMPSVRAEELILATETAYQALMPLLEARRLAGRVRRCHGDLHLGNICLLEGRPVLFDGIEFSELIACIDVLYDLAFLLMDLVHREAQGLANLLFNRYLDRSDEGDGLALMPLFLSLRAGVRAHVTARAGDTLAADTYLDLARRLLRPVPPRLVAIGGLSGTGKSSVAARLAPLIGRDPGARHLRSDVLRKRLFNVAPEAKLPPEAYTTEINDRVYGGLLSAARQALTAGHSVLLDAVAAKPAERAAFQRLAAEMKVPFAGLWLEGDPRTLAARIAARRNDASDADSAVLRQQLAYDPGPLDWSRVDAGDALDAVVAAARQALDA